RGLARNRRPGADPHDLLQDTFVNIYRYAGSFKPDAPGGFGAWSRTIAANVVRRSGVRPQSAGTLFADCDGAERFVADAAGTPARAAEDREETGQLHAAYLVLLQHYAHAFGALKERDRRALELVEVEGLDYAEVGRRLGTRRSNTKMILFRARKRLLAAMETSLAGPDRAAEAA
ncbi:MAG: sigma-70 family RNA polymerase sigma factor, partial [Planctomycetota bacterium]